MPDENNAPTTEATTEKPADKAAPSTRVAPPSLLQHDSDRVARPGFRNPPNAKSKAQKKGGKK